MANKPTYEELEQKVRNLVQGLKKCEQAEETLRKEHELTKIALDSQLDTFFFFEPFTGKAILWNRTFNDITGYSDEEIAGMAAPGSYYSPEDLERTYIAINEVMEKGTGTIELGLICKDGRKVHTEYKVSVVKNQEGRSECFISIGRDITNRKRAEEELKRHRDHLEELVVERTKELQEVNEKLHAEITERIQAEDELKRYHDQLTVFKQFAEKSNQGMGWADMEGRIVYINSALAQMFGVKRPEDVYGKPVQSTFYPESIEQRLNEVIFPTVLKEGKWQGESEIRTKHGKSLLTYESLFLIKDKNGNPLYFANVLSDITERKQTEELIHSLSHQLITSQESERQMISYELHDSVAQDLSSSRITCEMLLKYKSLTPGVRKQISKLSESLHKTLKGVRDLSYGLRPPGLEELGLTDTMYHLCEDFSAKTAVKIDFQSAGMDNLNLNYTTKINLYRVLQEALNNVRKHSDANNVKIRLIASFPSIILRIKDDGKGFDLKERLARTSNEKRMGLSSIEERVALLLGSIDIKSNPGKGTSIIIAIPNNDENTST